MEEVSFNWLAQGAAALSALVVGFVWYHEKVFGAAWMGASGMTREKAQKGNMVVTFGLALVFAFMISTVLFGLLNSSEEHRAAEFMTFKHGAFHGVMLALFAALPIIGTNALFEQKGWKYIAINTGYWVVTLAVMGGIISAWR